jgi:hypothetical protein
MARLTKKRYVELIAKFGLTDEDVKTVCANAHAVWEDVGFDVLAAVAEEKGKTAEDVTVSKRDVIEIVLDADRLASHLHHDKRAQTPGITALMADRYNEDGSALLYRMMGDTFQYQRYGL